MASGAAGLARAACLVSGAALLGSAALASRPVQLPGNIPAAATNITVTVTNMRSSKGVVLACITTDPKGFPKCDDDATSFNLVAKAAAPVTFNFKNIAPGHYAIALLHDENNNGKADRALLMIPSEGFGFSRDAKVRMGPPKFEDAAFDVAGGSISQTIKMRYLI